MLHLIGRLSTRIALKLGDSARYENGPPRERFADAQRKRRLIWNHAEPVGSARLAEHNNGRASLLFLSRPNILQINRRPRARSLIVRQSRISLHLTQCNFVLCPVI